MNEGHESVDVPLLIDVSNDSRKVFKKESGCQSNSTFSTVDQQTSRLQARKELDNNNKIVRFPFKAGSSSTMIGIKWS